MFCVFLNPRQWINFYLESEIPRTLADESVAGGSIYFGAKHLMAYTQLCLIANELGRCVTRPNEHCVTQGTRMRAPYQRR